MVYSDLSMIDASNNLIDISINKIMGIELPNINNLYFIQAYIWGCTAGFNHALLEMVPSVDIDKDYLYIEKLAHDSYFAKFALEYGKVLFCPEQLVLYRRHGHNVTTSHHFKLSPLNVFRKAILGFNELALTHARVYNQTLYMLKKASGKNPLSDRLLEIQEVIKIGGLKGVRYFYQNRISRKQLVRTIGLYTIMLFGAYKKYIMKELL
ncbi:TPA: rhamnosyl transferase [Streptococcus pneumoniae]|nr:rhamnosyl transferase [Streptococcus pneumoniae]